MQYTAFRFPEGAPIPASIPAESIVQNRWLRAVRGDANGDGCVARPKLLTGSSDIAGVSASTATKCGAFWLEVYLRLRTRSKRVSCASKLHTLYWSQLQQTAATFGYSTCKPDGRITCAGLQISANLDQPSASIITFATWL